MGADSERLAVIQGRADRELHERFTYPTSALVSDVTWLQERLRAVESERDMLLALVDDACASDDLTALRDWQTSRLLKETQQ